MVLEKARQRGTPEEAAAIETRFFDHLESDEELASLAATVGGLYFYDRDSEAAKTFGINTHFSAAAYNRSVIDIHAQHNVIDRLGEIDVPTLVLCGPTSSPPTSSALPASTGAFPVPSSSCSSEVAT